MKRSILLIFTLLLILPVMSFGQEFYRWVDEKGTIHFTDDPTLIPERYRSQAQPKKPLEESPTSPAAPVAPASPAGKAPKPVKPQEQASEPPKTKDMLGRGEQWWRAKVKEWSDKLAVAQKGYEGVQTALKEKSKELDDSLFKPDSLKRKLRAEKKVLEDRVKDQEIKIQEAKNMLEKALPKEARDYGADPIWLKPKE